MDILVIEDECTIRDSLITILTMEGYATSSAANGREGLEVLNKTEELPQLILLDWSMPEMGGADFLKVRDDDSRLRTIPIIVISAFEKSQLLTNSKPVSYHQKPFNFEKLLTEISSILDLRKKNKACRDGLVPGRGSG